MAHGVVDIRWTAPWLAPYRGLGEQLGAEIAAGRGCAEILNTAAGSPVRFVPQSELPPGISYEEFIHDTRQVPTRDGLHDFFNGLSWLHFPATKARLNVLQAALIARDGIQPVRGAARDALTLFDENAAFFVGPDSMWDALGAKDWQRLFVRERSAWREVQLVLFGHALLEKLVEPRKATTAHVYRVRPASGSFKTMRELDAVVAAGLSAEIMATKPFAHLPVLGVPGWWDANSEPAFYEDKYVFRKSRTEMC